MTYPQKAMLKLLMTFCVFFCSSTLFAQLPKIVINEFLASNQTTNQDPDFSQFSDWLELYNTTASDIDISGYFLTDNMDNPSKWQFPGNTLIPAQGYLLVWADGKDVDLHTNFKISKGGEELALSNTDTLGIDSIRFGSQEDDISYGRVSENLSEWAYFSPPSPGIENNSINTVDITPEPVFSIEGGFYSGSQSVSFINAGEVDIYYSLDGTPPDDSSTPYTNPIIINRTTPIRAIAYQAGKPSSDVITNTYFIDIPVNLPVISIVTDPDNFFDDEIGIYVTGVNGTGGYCAGVVSNVNQDWERPVNVELYEMDGDQGLNQRAGVKIFGGCSRHRYPQKSLSLFARNEYGKGSFNYKLFEEKDIDKFETFILRSSADDQMWTMFRDAAAQQLLVNTMDADYQAYQPVVVYLNGDYWGIHNIREKLNEHYIAGNFGVDPNDVNILANDGSNWNTSHGSNVDYTSMFNFVTTNNMANPNTYEKVKGMMDIDQYIDYMVGHIYLAERDWPGNNIKFWKANTGEYTRWRWINFDLDQTLTYYWIIENMIDKSTTDRGTGWPNPEWSTRLFRNLLKNQEFRNQFINQYSWHMSTTFDSTRVIAIIDSLADRIRPEIPYHIEKWGGLLDETGSAAESWISPTFDSIELWESNVDTMRIFARKRQQHTVQNMVDHFGLSGASRVNVNLSILESGLLKILGKKIPDGFKGKFFNDVPVQLSATSLLGYNFSHWEERSGTLANIFIINVGAEWKYHDLGADLGVAWTQTDYDDGSWTIGFAQLGYGDGDEATIVDYGGNPNNKHITTYFRKSFELSDPQSYISCTISLLVDDGAVAFLNGNEIARVNMPEGDIDYLTTAPVYIPDETAFHNFTVPVELLATGTNVIAVEIHQSSSTSSDLSFDCSFSGSSTSEGKPKTYTTQDIEIAFSGDITLTAHFEADTIQNENLVVISEINYRSAAGYNTEDWIEIYNNSGTVIDMTGWKFMDSANDAFLFPNGYLFEQGEYLVLCRDSNLFKEKNPSITRVLGDFNFGLSSEGELIRIVNNNAGIVDEVDYKVAEPWPITANSTGYTIELKDLALDNNVGENWIAANLYGTPGTPYTTPSHVSNDGIDQPAKYALYTNYPNPFNPSTMIHFSLNQSGFVRINIYNMLGQNIRTLVDRKMETGKHQLAWDGKTDAGKVVSSGVYIVTLKMADKALLTRNILFIK